MSVNLPIFASLLIHHPWERMMRAREEVKPALEAEWSLPIVIGDLADEIRKRAEGMGFARDDIFEQWEFYIRQLRPFPWIVSVDNSLGPWSELCGHEVFALNLLWLPASEASCERSIGQERDLLGESPMETRGSIYQPPHC
jgi:hypothetical protein